LMYFVQLRIAPKTPKPQSVSIQIILIISNMSHTVSKTQNIHQFSFSGLFLRV